jgi:tetratricopeptide (TPR) repeat protein
MSAAVAVLLLVWSAEVAAPTDDRSPPPNIFPRIDFDPERCHQAARSGRDDVAVCDLLLAGPGISVEQQTELLDSRARIHHKANRFDLAEADLSAALLLAPDNGRLYINRGNLRLSMGDALAALSDYNLGVDLTFASEPRAFYNRAFAHRALGDLRAALDDFDTARIIAASQWRGSSVPVNPGKPLEPGTQYQ